MLFHFSINVYNSSWKPKKFLILFVFVLKLKLNRIFSNYDRTLKCFDHVRSIDGTAKGANYRCEIGGSLYEKFLGQFWQGYYAISVHVSSILDWIPRRYHSKGKYLML